MTIPDAHDLTEVHRGARHLVRRGSLRPGEATVVIKTVAPGHPSAQALAEGLRREHQRLAGLPIAGVARALGLDQDGGGPALVLEDAGAQNLAQWLRRRPVSVEVFLSLALQLTEILVRLHERALIHRALDPTNVVVGPSDRLTLVDFGAATFVPRDAGVPPRLSGSLLYIAPEETGRMNRIVDHRADLYSLGAIFHELLTGAPPFPALTPLETVHAHLARAPVPPARASAGVPVLLSDLTLKLLAKTPERRYQSAEALLADLREASRRFTGDSIAGFELGLVDLARALPLPERLYGRGPELAALREDWERAAAGAHAVVELRGPPGVGKSALTLELRRILEPRVPLLLGKFDQPGRGVPCAPLAEAFGPLMAALLLEPADLRERWRLRVQAAVGRNGQAIVEVVPRLEELLGPLPALPALGPLETENRLLLTFEAFVRALATAERPMALCLDDLQWADALSLRLFRALAAAPDLHHLLLVGAVRSDGEADPLAEIEARRLELSALDLEGVLGLCCDALRCEPVRGRPLAELILAKTAGNPLFVCRLLRFLHQSEALIFDAALGTWTWDLARIQAVAVSENVVDLLLVALRRLPARTQEVLQNAACIGNRFSLELLAAVCDRDREGAAGAVWIAVAEGLLLPLEGPAGGDFQFAHDRVQQAIYSLWDERRRRAAHLRVGRALLRLTAEGDLEDRLFAIAGQLHLGAALVEDAGERTRFAELFLRAATKARRASLHDQALAHARRGIELLPADAWQSHPATTFALHRIALEAAHFAGTREEADQLLAAALAGTRSTIEKGDLFTLHVHACEARGDAVEGLRRGAEGLRLFGVELPAGDPSAAVARELAEVRTNLRGRHPDELLAAPPMKGEEELACMRLLGHMTGAVFFARQELFPWVVGRLVNLSLLHGNASSSPIGFVSYALLLQRMTGDHRLGHAFGQMAATLSRRLGDPGIECRTCLVFAALINSWCAPLRTSVALAREAQPRGLEAGDLLDTVSCATTTVILRHHQGVALGVLPAEIDAALAMARRSRLTTEIDALLAYRQAVRSLQGLTRAPGSLDDAEFDEAAYLARHGGFSRTSLHLVRRLEIAYLLRDFPRARELAEAATRPLMFARAFVLNVEHAFYAALTMAGCCQGAAAEERAAFLGTLATHQRQLGVWADNCPENYRHKHLLVSAELARLEGRGEEAVALYDQAIDAAAEAGFPQDEALACELAGRFHRTREHRRIAAMYLSSALEGYGRWGARAKVEALEEEWGAGGRAGGARPPAARAQDGGPALDLTSLFSAAEAISSEVVLDRLLEKLMSVCLAAAGADRGAVLLDEAGTLYLRATGSVAGPAALQRRPLDQCQALVPCTFIEHVSRGDEAVVISDAVRPGHGGFPDDPYFAAGGARSVMALPMRRQGQGLGVLYLENALATRVFTPDRVQVLRLLSSQIATSLQISRLFAGLTHEIDERKRAEAAMRFLADASVALASSLDERATLKLVARLAVGSMADWCVVDVFEEGEARRVAAAHADPAKEELLHRLRELQDRLGAPVQALDMRHGGGGAVLVPEAKEPEMRRYLTDPEALRLAQQIGVGSSMILPLRARERLLGTMTLVSTPGGRRYDERDLALGDELARRAAMAIDNARLYREAQDAVRLRDDFLSIASHELNTPIAALQLTIEGFEQAAVVASRETLERMVRLVTRQSRRLGTLVKELLSVAELQAGRLHVERATVDLARVVREIAEELGPELLRARCKLTVDAPVPVEGQWDRTRLDQIVTNLMANAIKYGAGTRIAVTVEEAPRGTARLVVEDEGIGIDPERLRRLFGRFDRAVSASHYGGMGLGLYVVKEIVSALGGTVSVKSTAKTGSTFTVELPCGSPPSTPLGGPDFTPAGTDLAAPARRP